jgi:hypothetical protein
VRFGIRVILTRLLTHADAAYSGLSDFYNKSAAARKLNICLPYKGSKLNVGKFQNLPATDLDLNICRQETILSSSSLSYDARS